MKNKIFRVAIAITLTIAMTLTFVGCSSSSGDVSTPTVTVNPDATAAPVITQTPVEKTPTPTSTPKVQVSEDFGLSVKGVGGTYGTNLEDAYENEQAPAYFEISWEESLTEAHYELVLEVEIESDNAEYYYVFTIPSANASRTNPTCTTDGTTYMSIQQNEDDDYFYPFENEVYFTITENTLTIWLEDAGEYELACEAFVTDASVDFGAWNSEDDPEEFEFYLSSELEIAKEQITIEIPPAVIVESESSLYVLPEGEYNGREYTQYNTSYDSATDSTTVYLPASFNFGEYKESLGAYEFEIELSYGLEYVEEGKVGTYAVEIEEEYAYGGKTYDNLDDLNELFDNYEIVKVVDTAIYVISSYDYAELADVITSIAEINFTSNTFFGQNGNIEVQLPLAENRYNALSTQQKAYFDTFANVEFNTYSRTNVNLFVSYEDKDEIEATSGDQAIALKEYMEFAREKLDDYLIIEAFEEFAEDSELPEYSLLSSTFNVLNSKHIAYFNAVDEYFKALDDDSRDLIKNSDSDWYYAYKYASDCILNAEIDSVEQLIVGAYQAYLKSITGGTTIVYQSTVSDGITSNWAYIESDEVVSLTNQAYAAYEALSEDGKDLLENRGADSMIYDLSFGGDKVVFENGKNTVYNALEKLLDMNEMIETMIIISQYVNIDDYTTNDLAYSRLTRLVYGVDGVTGETGGMYFPTYTGTANATDYRYAMQDIINAPERNYDAIIAEYKEWLLYIEAIETYKTTVMVEFMSQLDYEVSNLDKDDYEESVLSKANSSSIVYGLILASVKAESTAVVNGMYDALNGGNNFNYYDILNGESGVDITPFIDAEGNFLDRKDSFDEIYEAYDDFLDMDDLLDSYIDAIKEKE